MGRRPSRRDLARRIGIGVLVAWGAGSLMVASDATEGRGLSFLVIWSAIFVAGLALAALLLWYVLRP